MLGPESEGSNEEHVATNGETTALLPPSSESRKPTGPTPLPKLQLSILLVLQLTEPLAAQCIFPFINQLVSELDITGGDETKVGYYAGLIESLFFATQMLFVFHWSRLSDHIGRKPVLLIGAAGTSISMICFGLSKTFWGLVISRCVLGMLNGNVAVIKSMMGELTDSSNMAQGFALIPVVWSAGATLSPFMGGTLAKPHDRWPHIFSHPIWIEYPYLLPCAVGAMFSAITFFILAVFLKETVQRGPQKDKYAGPEPEGFVQSHAAPATKEPVPFRKLFVPSVMIPVANYGLLALMDIAFFALEPLFLSTPIELGGLGQTPARIGVVLGTFGLISGLFQALCLPSIVRRWGPKRVFMNGMAMFTFIFALFPLMNYLARRMGLTRLVWATLALQLGITAIMDMAFACITMFIRSAAPNRHSLGATNGLASLAASIARAVGPASSTSLFALSVQKNWLGGYAVYGVLIVISWFTLFVANLLPERI